MQEYQAVRVVPNVGCGPIPARYMDDHGQWHAGMALMRNRPPAISLAQRYSARAWEHGSRSTWREPCSVAVGTVHMPTDSLKDIEIALPDGEEARCRRCCCCCSVGLGRAVSSPPHCPPSASSPPSPPTVRITPRNLAIALQMHLHTPF
jgi:hypothetical protein